MSEDTHAAGAYAVRAAFKASKVMAETSAVFDAQREAKLPRFSWEEIVLGNGLGRGGFNDVFEVRHINVGSGGDELEAPGCSNEHSSNIEMDGVEMAPRENDHDQIDENAIKLALRNFTSEHCIRKKTGQPRYAIKFLSPHTVKDASLFQTGAADLITETMFLSSLEHPNIIKIRGITDQGVYGFASGLEGGFFILMDRLIDTLDTQLDRWAIKEKRAYHFFRRTLSSKVAQKRFDYFTERLHCALDVCAALAYLHSHNIVYRDLKPENIGFDCRGDVKIFDFGLSTELLPDKQLDDGLYNLTGQTGSLRYMAPEVAKSNPYNLSADVYSFSVLLWELCSLEVPYDGMDRLSHANYVVYGTHRPPIDNSWCFSLCSLMARGWHEDIRFRPNMDSCYKMIRKELVARRNGDETGLDHVHRRSTYVFKVPSRRSLQGICRRQGKARSV